MKSVTPIRMSATLMAAAFLLAGCDKENENTVDNQPVKARITSVIDGMSTRASGTAWAPGDRIGITATKADGTVLLSNAPYVTTDGNGTFTPEGDEFYYQDGDDVTFTAYYPFAESSYITDDGGMMFQIGGLESQKPENQPKFDFLFATTTGSSSSPDLQLRFRHCMSRFVLRFLPGTGVASLDDITYELSGIITGGIFNTLTGETIVNETSVSVGLTVPGSNASELTSPLILFPQQSEDDKTLTLTMRGKTYTATFKFKENPNNGNVRELAAGHTYTYNVKINNTSMTITPATISNWEEGGSENIDSTNN